MRHARSRGSEGFCSTVKLCCGASRRLDVRAIARCENNRNIRLHTADSRVRLGTIYFGQHHIEKQQINLIAMAFKFADRSLTIIRGNNRVTETFESLTRQFAKSFVVLGEESQFRSAADRGGNLRFERSTRATPG